MSPLLLKLIFSRLPQGPMPFFLRPIVRGIADKAQARYVDPQLALHVDYWESELGKDAWFVADELTAADIQMSFRARGGPPGTGFASEARILSAAHQGTAGLSAGA